MLFPAHLPMSLSRHHTDTTAVILLAFVLAAGFLLVILSCALWNNWLPLLVGEWFHSIRPYEPMQTWQLEP